MAIRFPRPIEVHVINLDRDADRWAETRAAFERFDRFGLVRSPGVDASHLPRAAGTLLCRTPRWKAGTLGCFMAHVKAWESVAARRRGWILVAEDDVEPARPNRLFKAEVPDDADLVWINRRMDPGARAEDEKVPVAAPARAVLAAKAALKPGRAAPGGDGYLLSAEGARKLLAAVEADGMAQHVDWMLLRYALSPDDVRVAAGDGWLLRHPALDPDASPMRWSVVTGYCLSPALMHERPGRNSSRRAADGQGTTHEETPEGLVSEFWAAGCRFRFLVADQSDVIQRRHFVGRLYEAEELGIIQAHFPRGGIYVDIGANVGNHAVFVARKLRPSRIHVFEPNPAATAILRTNLRLNEVEGVVDASRLGVGLGEAAGNAEMHPRDHNLGATRLTPHARGTVPVIRGDDALRGIRPDFLKVDVEGMEVAVLRGLETTIAEHRPLLFVEVDDRNAAAMADWIAAHGYAVAERFRRYAANENLMLVPRERGTAAEGDGHAP